MLLGVKCWCWGGDHATREINAVVMISAGIEIDVFRRKAPTVLAAGVPIYLLESSDDKVLRLSAKIRRESPCVGSVRSDPIRAWQYGCCSHRSVAEALSEESWLRWTGCPNRFAG